MAYAFLNPPPTSLEGPPRLAELSITAPPTVEALTTAAATNAIMPRAKAVAWVRMAPDILRAMTLAANHAGRTASEVWAEAAREWLLRKSLDADYDVLAYAPVRKRPEDGVLEATRKRLWGSIDTAMEGIRQVASVVE